MAKRPPNPNTIYGRRRLQEEAWLKKEQWRNDNPEEAAKSDSTMLVIGISFLVILFVLYFMFRTGNSSGDHYGERGGHYKINSHGNKEYYKKGK